MKLAFFAIAVAVTTAPTLAAAFEFSGATLEYSYRDSDAFTQKQLSGNAAFSFGNGFGAQIGLKHAVYNDGYLSNGAEAHLTYGFGSDVVLGAFYGIETFAPIDYRYYGTEVAYVSGPIAAQASISHYTGENYDATNFTLDGSYGIGDQFDLLAGYHTVDDGTGKDDYLYVGASYSFLPSLAVKATYGRLDVSSVEDNVATIGLVYTFGAGATFNQRSYTDIFPTN